MKKYDATRYDDLFDFLKPHLNKKKSKLSLEHEQLIFNQSNPVLEQQNTDINIDISKKTDDTSDFYLNNLGGPYYDEEKLDKNTLDINTNLQEVIEKKNFDQISIFSLAIEEAFCTQIKRENQRKAMRHLSDLMDEFEQSSSLK